MNRTEFISELSDRLSGLPEDFKEESIGFYSEMIDDGIEEGLSEEEAVSRLGSVEGVASEIIAQLPVEKIREERIKSKRGMHPWQIILLALGSPIWISLGVAVAVVALSLYVSMWAVIISLWSAYGALTASSFGASVGGLFMIFTGRVATGFALFGAGLVCAGVSVFLFFGCKAATVGVLSLTKMTVAGIKNAFAKRGEKR